MRKQPLSYNEVISVRFKFKCRSLLSVKKTWFFYLIFHKNDNILNLESRIFIIRVRYNPKM